MALKRPGVALGLAVLVGMGSATLLLTQHHMPCEQRAPLTVIAGVAAFVIAFSIRQFGTAVSRVSRGMLFAALLIAAVSLFADARFVFEYREICNAPLPMMNP